jgi:hypothetical protein
MQGPRKHRRLMCPGAHTPGTREAGNAFPSMVTAQKGNVRMEGKTPREAAEAARLAAMTPAERERAGYIEGLRMLADLLEKHAGIPLPVTGRHSSRILFPFGGTPEGVAAMAATRKAFPCAWEKHFSGGGEYTDWLDLRGRLAGLEIELYAPRDAVCKRIVKGTEEREVEEVVRPAETRMVRKRVDVVDWECSPVLAADAPAKAAAETRAAT